MVTRQELLGLVALHGDKQITVTRLAQVIRILLDDDESLANYPRGPFYELFSKIIISEFAPLNEQ